MLAPVLSLKSQLAMAVQPASNMGVSTSARLKIAVSDCRTASV